MKHHFSFIYYNFEISMIFYLKKIYFTCKKLLFTRIPFTHTRERTSIARGQKSMKITSSLSSLALPVIIVLNKKHFFLNYI